MTFWLADALRPSFTALTMSPQRLLGIRGKNINVRSM